MPSTDLELRRARAVARTGLLAARSHPGLDIVARAAANAMRTSIGFVSLIGNSHAHAIGSHGLDMVPVERDKTFCDHTIAGFEPLVVEDARRDGRFRDNPFVTGPPFLRAYAGVP